MAELHVTDPIADANEAIRIFIRALPDGIITTADRPGYEALVDAYFAAIRERDQQRRQQPETARLAA